MTWRNYAAPVCAALLFVAGCAVHAPFGGRAWAPRLTPPALALIHDDAADNPQGFVALSLTGAGFGAPRIGDALGDCGEASGPFVEIAAADRVQRIASMDRRVRWWTDTQVVVTVSPGGPLASARLCTERGWTPTAAVAVYRYDHFALPPTRGTNPAPLALAVDARRRVWINEEFHLELKYFDPERQKFGVLSIPRPPDPGPFALTLNGESATQISQHGEAIAVDPSGRVWFTQGGGAPYAQSVPDHSRVVAYDPARESGRFAVFNVPGDHNGVYGGAWDESRQRVWFTQAARRGPPPARESVLRARLTSFDPSGIRAAGRFDFSTDATCSGATDSDPVGWCSNGVWQRCLDADDCVLADLICPPGAVATRACYRVYQLPPEAEVVVPGHVAVHPLDASIWYTAYWGGNHIGRLDPDSGELLLVPLPVPDVPTTCDDAACDCAAADLPASCRSCCVYRQFGVAPWDLDFTGRGDVVFSEYLGGAVGRLRIDALRDATCTALDRRGRNPCVDEVDVTAPGLRVHSLAIDEEQEVWFTQDGPMEDAAALTSLGYVLADWSGYVLLPPLALFPFFNSDGSYCPTERWAFVGFTGAGIAIDPQTHDIWFADYCRKRLGRLRKLP